MDMACSFCRLNKLDTVGEERANARISLIQRVKVGPLHKIVWRSVNDMLLTSSVQVVMLVLRGRRKAARGPLLRLSDRQVLHEVVSRV